MYILASLLRTYAMNKAAPTWDTDLADAWASVVWPSRPSTEDMANIERFMMNPPGESMHVLILGSTAEYRTLCYTKQVDSVTVAEHMRENFFRMRNRVYAPEKLKDRHARCSSPGTELVLVGNKEEPCDVGRASIVPETELVEIDWRNITYKNCFDLILGDLAINMVPMTSSYEGDDYKLGDQERVLNVLRQALQQQNGVAMQRIWVRDDERYGTQNTSFEAILEAYNHDSHKSNRMHPFYWLALPLMTHFYDAKRKGTYFQDILQKLREGHETGLVDDRTLASFESHWGDYHMPNMIPTKDELEGAIERAGLIANKVLHTEADYNEDGHMCPTYVLQAA